MHQELKNYKSLLLESGFDVAVATGNYSDVNWLMFEKNGILGYVQFNRISGFSFSSVNHPSKEFGTGKMIFRNVYPASLENAEHIIKDSLSDKSVRLYKNLDEYINYPINKILNYKIVKALQKNLI